MKLFDWIGNITKETDIKFNSETERSYNPFIISRSLANYEDCVLLAGYINKFELDKDQHYMALHHLINKRPRYDKWAKKVKPDVDATLLTMVKEYYGVREQLALDYLEILTDEQIEFIKRKMTKD